MRAWVAILAVWVIPAGASSQNFPGEPAPIQAGVAPGEGMYAPGIDVLHYEVEVGVSQSDWFEGQVGVEFRALSDRPLLPLDLSGLLVTGLTLDGDAIPIEHVEGVLRVALPSVAKDEVHTVTVAYGGRPDDALALQNNIHGDPVAFVDNWPNRTRFWLPSVDHPSDKATVRYTVHAPKQWKVVANGHLVGDPEPTTPDALGPGADRRTWIYEVGVPISTYNMVIGAADMEVRSVGLAACGQAPASRRDDGCVDVTYWVFPADVEKAAPSFRRAADIVDYFTNTIGPYPFEKLANVQTSTRFGGMENASAIFYSEQAIASGRNIEGTVSHEIAHQWFGDAVTEANWQHLWLSEGFATYFGALFFEHADGPATFRERMEESRQRVLGSGDTDRPIVDPTETDLFALLNDNNYPKGGWVLHMLRGLLGDDTFFQGIRTYYRENLHGAVLTGDFQSAMERVSGRDLEWFFHQWIYQPGYPVFDVTHEWNAAQGVVEVTVRQVQKEAWPRFRMPLTLLVQRGDQLLRTEVEVRGDSQRFTVATDGPADRVEIDPDGWVLKAVNR